MELAALPGDGREDGGTGGGQSAVVVADDEAQAMKATGLEGGKEGAPVRFGFAEGDADAEDGAFAIGADPQGHQDGAVEQLAAVADLFVAGVEDQVGSSFPGDDPARIGVRHRAWRHRC